MSNRKIVITGGSGYVAQNLRKGLAGAPNNSVICLSRTPADGSVVVADYTDPAHYADADVVIHCAALAHTDDNSDAAVLEFFRANMELPDRLAKVLSELPKPPRLIFFSSLGAREAQRKLDAGQHPASVRKQHPYQLSKLYAERALSAYKKLDITCLRPPLIYGPGAPGNLAKLIKLIEKGIPLPTGLAAAPRGYCFIANLMSAVEHVVEQQQAGFHVYEVGDAEQLSTRALVTKLGTTYNKKPIQLPIPLPLLRIALGIIGQSKAYGRLFDPMPVSNSGLVALGWQPPFSVAEGLAALKTPGVAAPKIAL